jgi:hypothetical protein
MNGGMEKPLMWVIIVKDTLAELLRICRLARKKHEGTDYRGMSGGSNCMDNFGWNCTPLWIIVEHKFCKTVRSSGKVRRIVL